MTRCHMHMVICKKGVEELGGEVALSLLLGMSGKSSLKIFFK